MIATTALVAVLTLCCSLYYLFTRTFNYWNIRDVANPKPVPLFGNLLDSALRRKNIGDVFKEIYDQFPDEKVVGVYRMTTPALLLRDLDVIKDVLIKDFDNFSDRGFSFSKNGLGNNLFHAESDRWRILRSKFNPLFTSGKLKNMMYLLEERGDKLLEYIQNMERSEQDLLPIFKGYTMATIVACSFGLDVETINGETNIFKAMDVTIFSPSFLDELDMMFPIIFKTLKLNPMPQVVTEFFLQVVSTAIEKRNGVSTNRHDFMDLLITMKEEHILRLQKNDGRDSSLTLELTDDIIAAQALAFYAGGYESSAITVSLAVYELARNPEVQREVIAEVDAVLARHGGRLGAEAVSELELMERVLSETLRLYPVVEPLQRRALCDYKIPGTDVTVKKDQMVIVSTKGIHRDPKYYPDPDRFDPGRFTAENSKDRHTCAHMPFGVGPRYCIGMRFAKCQLKVCLAKFFSKFRVEPTAATPANISFKPRRVVMAPREEVLVNILPR
ncbi:cytochrome P450 6B4-like [Battus philenor]|uniref:cytochrome P450 6B4-like n=1 Tax=Battus philenor TaxID=42288 RepID=UPI0035CF8A80